MPTVTRDHVIELLGEVLDPEVPVLDVVSMGIVRDVAIADDGVIVSITPTYSGCPAMHAIRQLILERLRVAGLDAKVETILSPPWTTDWMTDEAREKLRAYGIAPPDRGRAHGEVPASVVCPHCGSEDTRLKSAFGSTACKALYVCSSCREPFEHFKCI